MVGHTESSITHLVISPESQWAATFEISQQQKTP